jgi:hypothetical protein
MGKAEIVEVEPRAKGLDLLDAASVSYGGGLTRLYAFL